MSSVRVLAQSDPVPNLARQLGDAVHDARDATAALIRACRALDTLREQLADHNIAVDVDLGEVGNAAAATRRDLEKRSDTPTFKMP
jgi:hypothetical protein